MTTAHKYAGVEITLSAEDKTIFGTISAVRRALMQAGIHPSVADEYTEIAMRCSSYEEVLRITKTTVDVT